MNRLRSVPERFRNLIHLQALTLDHNQLRDLPVTFMHLTGLVSLSLGENELRALPASFYDLAELTFFDAWHLVEDPRRVRARHRH